MAGKHEERIREDGVIAIYMTPLQARLVKEYLETKIDDDEKVFVNQDLDEFEPQEVVGFQETRAAIAHVTTLINKQEFPTPYVNYDTLYSEYVSEALHQGDLSDEEDLWLRMGAQHFPLIFDMVRYALNLHDNVPDSTFMILDAFEVFLKSQIDDEDYLEHLAYLRNLLGGKENE
jgi:hypothetical protein